MSQSKAKALARALTIAGKSRSYIRQYRRHAGRTRAGAPPPDTTKWPNPRFAMPYENFKTRQLAERVADLRDSQREVARACESITKAARELRVSHRTAKKLRS